MIHPSRKNNQIYLDSEESEAWGMVNERDKEKENEFLKKMTMNQFGIPASAKKVEVLKGALEINQAEKLIVDQKKHIGELEAIVKNIKNTNSDLEQRRQELKKKLTEFKQSCNAELLVYENTKNEKTNRNEQNRELNERLQVLLAYEKKKRKIAEIKTLALQASLRKSENFIITIDSFYNKCLKG